MGILVQLVIAAVLYGPLVYMWVFVLSYLVEPGAALVLALVCALVSSLLLARRLYWSHERKHQTVTYVYYPPNVRRP